MNDIKKKKIYQNYYNKVYGYLLNKTNYSHDAEDLAADVFVKVYEKFDSYDETKASLSTWIYTITHNTLIDYYRTHREYSEIPETIETGYSTEDDICNEEMLVQLADALESLEERERKIVVQRYYYDKSLKEIAEEMNISYSYVKVLQQKALEKMKKILSSE